MVIVIRIIITAGSKIVISGIWSYDHLYALPHS